MLALIITLVNCPDRKASAEFLAESLTRWGFTPILFEATDCRSPEFAELKTKPFIREAGLTDGEVACAWSHYRAALETLHRGTSALIVEDDAEFTRIITPEEFDAGDLLSLSAYDQSDSRVSFDVIKVRPFDDVTVGLPYGTQAYFLSPAGAAQLVEDLIPIRHASDVALGDASRRYVLTTHLAHLSAAVQSGRIQSYIGPR